MIADAA